MAKFYLKNGWFGPDGHLYPKSQNSFDAIDIPDEFVKLLPKSASPKPLPIKPEHIDSQYLFNGSRSIEIDEEAALKAPVVDEAKRLEIENKRAEEEAAALRRKRIAEQIAKDEQGKRK